jgi:FtsP/CotA-like multicopper oxidase with cupredoxin domain
MDRRSFVASTGAVLATAIAVPMLPRQAGGHAPRRRQFDLTARPVRRHLLPGVEVDMLGYNGQVPGPVLEVFEGDEVAVRFENQLAEPSTIHWHGLHLPFEADGSPFRPVPPGESYDYHFTPAVGSAGTYWYHPHPHARAGHQVAMGLAGALIVRAHDDPLAGVPEQLLFLSDNRLDGEGAVDLPEPKTLAGRIDLENGREGPLLFVNGALQPTLSIRSGEMQRWRVVNASAARSYRLALEGHTLLHVGNDGGLFEHPVEVDEILLSPSERVEVLVRATATPGTMARLQSLPYDRYIPQTRPADWDQPLDLLTLAYSREPAVPPMPVPERLRVVTPLDPAASTATRVMSLSQGLINGRRMDPDRMDVVAPLGATEIWQVENLVGMDHPFHLHGFQFQVLDRHGVPEPFPSWQDTVNVPKHQQVRFIVRYDDYPGKWMFHCHILDHEDHGMMGVLEVR